jgi:preprotein translocase SecE subunit
MANQNQQASDPKGGGSIPIPKSRRGLKGFVAEVQREMKKVTWPTRQETNRLTSVVLTVCLAIVTIIYTMSFVFEKAIDFITKGKV